MVPFFVNEALPKYPDWPLAPSPALDRLVDWLESCPDDERELARRGERVAESMIEDHGLREHRGWYAISFLRVDARPGCEVAAAEWLLRRGIAIPGDGRRSRRRELGRALEQAGVDLETIIAAGLFDYALALGVTRNRKNPRRSAAHPAGRW